MKNFFCRCGQRIFFDNTECGNCHAQLGFDVLNLQLAPLNQAGSDPLTDDTGASWYYCHNRFQHQVCNWLIPPHEGQNFCQSCRLNDVIPNLGQPENILLWQRLESAKRRLLYSLMSLGLPFGGEDGRPGLRFSFLEDQRRNPDVLEPFVSTGHVAGKITINTAEADDVARHEIREQMQERYRTLLGHFRHESGHYYFDLLVPQGDTRWEFRQLFGDERDDYAAALEAHYRNGPPPDWPANYVSSYAAAHPHEDWAETFAHYLHIRDALETADASELLVSYHDQDWIVRWMSLSVTLNELNRSLGIEDPYPFVLPDPVAARLRFIDRHVARVT